MKGIDEHARRRYGRQIIIPEIGEEGQLRLMQGSVGIVGCGALGSMAAMQLAGAGIGRIGLCDADTIDVSNLQRQLYFTTHECGQSKSEVLTRRILDLNPGVNVESTTEFLTVETAADWLSDYDFIIEATDNAPTKFLVDKACAAIGVPCCIGGVWQFGGQVSTFLPGDARYSDFFSEDEVEQGSIRGVVGSAPAIVASVQVSEAIKYVAGIGVGLSGRLLTFDLLTADWQVISL